ncbi:hypothetical protein HFP05_07080 [Rhodanobacter denitrificans]|nr:hypothetical protein [Rhodanobacter denitrificans]
MVLPDVEVMMRAPVWAVLQVDVVGGLRMVQAGRSWRMPFGFACENAGYTQGGRFPATVRPEPGRAAAKSKD